MSHIRGKGNKDTELATILLFRKNGITGWRRNNKIIGKPDFLFPKNRIAVFIDGCFWHSCRRHVTYPKNNSEFWLKKLNSNKERDLQVFKLLVENNWLVIRVWEHELIDPDCMVRKLKFAIFCSCYFPKLFSRYFAYFLSNIFLFFHYY